MPILTCGKALTSMRPARFQLLVRWFLKRGWHCRRFSDKEVQRDAKLVSYDIIEKNTKPYVQVQIGDDNKARATTLCSLLPAQTPACCSSSSARNLKLLTARCGPHLQILCFVEFVHVAWNQLSLHVCLSPRLQYMCGHPPASVLLDCRCSRRRRSPRWSSLR